MQSFRKIVCKKLSPNFREATEIVRTELPAALGKYDVVVKNRFLGINASDINFTNGKYDPKARPPFDCGFESAGEVVRVGEAVRRVSVGDAVNVSSNGAFAEYRVVNEKHVHRIPFLTKEVLPLSGCGITASIALEEVGQMKSNETVLVTAAAGATGQFAVQLAKLAGNHVIGTCSSAEKVEFLKSIGCDRAINYTEESVKEVLKREYKNGVDLVFEGVGGEMFETCLNALAIRGRLVVIGMISGYEDGSAWAKKPEPKIPIQVKMLTKSTSVRGFFLWNYAEHIPKHVKKLIQLVQQGQLNAGVDPTVFCGLEGVSQALDYMYARKNIGKLVVELPDSRL